MVRPPDGPRRPVEGNPIRMHHRLRRERANPYRGEAVSRPSHGVVGRLHSHLSIIQTEPFIEVNRDNSVSPRIFQNIHTRSRSSNIEHSSIVYRSNIEQPQQPHNLRRTRNKNRRLGITNAEHQRSCPDAQEAATKQSEELRLLFKSYSEPEGPSESIENCVHQPQQGNSVMSKNQLQESQPVTSDAYEYLNEEPQPGTSGASEHLNEKPQVGTSSSTCGGGSSDTIFMNRRQGYWRPDLDNSSSSSEDEITDNHKDKFARRNPRKFHSERDIVQDVKTDMRAHAEMRRIEARITRTRNLSESSSDSESDLYIKPRHPVKNITVTDSQTKTSRNTRRRHLNRNIVKEVKADMRAQVETRRKEARLKGKRNFSDIDSDNESPKKSPLQRTTRTLASKIARTNLRRHHLEKDIPQQVKEDMRRQAEMRRKESRFTRNKNLLSNSFNSDSGIESAINIKADDHESRRNTKAETIVTEKSTKIDQNHPEVNIEADHCVAAFIIETDSIETENNIEVNNGCTRIKNGVVNDQTDCNTDVNSKEAKEIDELADFKGDDNIDARNPKTDSNSEAGIYISNKNIEVKSDKTEINIEVDHHMTQKNTEDGHQKAEKNIEDGNHKVERTIEDSHRKTEENIEECQHNTEENIEEGHHKSKENIEANNYKTEKNIVDFHKKPEKNNEDCYLKNEKKFVGGHHIFRENVEPDQRISRENKRIGQFESDGKFEVFDHDTAINSIPNIRNISNPFFNTIGTFDKRMGRHEIIHKTESSTTGSSHLKFQHSRSINQNTFRSLPPSMFDISKESTFTCSSLRNVFSDPFEEKWNKLPYDDEEDKERQESLKKLRNMLFELLFESQMSSPKGSTPVEQWWNKGRAEVYAKPVMKSNVKLVQSNVSEENETNVPSTRQDKVEEMNDICQSDKDDKTHQGNNDADQESKRDNA